MTTDTATTEKVFSTVFYNSLLETHIMTKGIHATYTVSRTAPIHKVCLSNYTGYNLKAQHYRAQPAADYSHADSLSVANTLLRVRIAGNSVPANEPYNQ